MCYDDACHLTRFAKRRAGQGEDDKAILVSKKIAEMEMHNAASREENAALVARPPHVGTSTRFIFRITRKSIAKNTATLQSAPSATSSTRRFASRSSRGRDRRTKSTTPEPPIAPRGRAIAPSVDAVASRRLKHYRGSVKYMRPGNFTFLLLMLCEEWNLRKRANAIEEIAKATTDATKRMKAPGGFVPKRGAQ